MAVIRLRAGGSPQAAGVAALRRSLATEMTRGDRVLRGIAAAAAVVPGGLVAFFAVVMVLSALPAIIFGGADFFTGSTFTLGHLYDTNTITHNGVTAPAGAAYGALSFIIGTVATSVIALVLAIPVSVGGVLMLAEMLPRRLEGFLSLFLELLAGIPRVVFWLCGVTFS